MDARRLRPPGHRAPARGQPALALGPARQLPDRRRVLRLHRRRLRRQLPSSLPGHGPAGPGRGPALRHAGRAGGPRRRDQRHRRRLDRRASPPTRSRRAASSTTSRSAPPTAPPTSSPTPTWRPGATSSPSTTRSSGRSASRRRFPGWPRTPRPPPRGAPRLGEHNHEVWCDLVGLSEDELADLVDAASSASSEPASDPVAAATGPALEARSGQPWVLTIRPM